MPRRLTHRVKPMAHRHKPRPRKLVGKELDLLLLAGCSCLLTVLYHPVAEVLQSAQSANSAQTAVATQVISKTPVGQTSPVHTTLPPQREKIKEEEEA